MFNLETIIVAGGKSARMNYVDKLNLPFANTNLLEISIAAAKGNTYLSTNLNKKFKNIVSVKDLFPEGGPAVGVWSCLQYIKSEYVLLLAADQPFITKFLDQLIDKATKHSVGAWLRVNDQPQPYASCVKTQILYDALKDSQGINVSMRNLLLSSNLFQIPITVKGVWDIDTWADYFYALGEVNEKSAMTEEWIETLSQQLNLEIDFLDKEEILDLTREVAHNIERKAAPLTTFLLGYLAGKKNLNRDEISNIISQIEETIEQIKDQPND